jgi:transposase
MNTKLTLTIEQSVIERAKSYAKEKGHSLSEIIENYLKTITIEQKPIEKVSPITKSLRGSFKAPIDFDYKEELSKALSEKYKI